MTEADSIVLTLERSFGLEAFREGQRDIIEAVLDGRDVVVVMPTGGGKSLCYQLPALLLPGLTIVVSPLIALMKDQVDALVDKGIEAAFINSTLAPDEQNQQLTRAANGYTKLLYVAPERFRSLQFLRTIAAIDVSLFAVDEAHCLSQWGHDFRPDYLKLGQALSAVGRPPVAAFTATATPEVREDIARSLSMVEPVTFFAGIDRPNLFLAFKYTSGKGGHEKKLRHVLETVGSYPDDTGIIYASTRKNVENVTGRLEDEGVRAMAYHAGLDDRERIKAQECFMRGDLQTIVATNAFGMGVDKADIRYVIHYDFPGSVEAYYQEVGRAGRDGKPAICLTLFSFADRYIQDFFLAGSNPSRELIEAVYRYLCDTGEERIERTVSEIAEEIPRDDSEMAVRTSMKVLERFGVISRGYRGEARAFVRLRRGWTEMLDALSRAPVQKAVAAGLRTVAQGDVARGAEVDLGALAYEAGTGREQVSRVLLDLQRGGHIEYEPPFRGRNTRVLLRETSDLPVDWDMLREKRRRDKAKIDMMTTFAQSEACRKWFLRRYFMGEGGSTRCGSCDRCAGSRGMEVEAFAETEEARWQRSGKAGHRGSSGRGDGATGSGSSRGDGSNIGVGFGESGAGGQVALPLAPGYASGPQLEGDALLLVRKVLSCVARMRGKYGRVKVSQVLKGSKEKVIRRLQLDGLSTYGLLADLRLEVIGEVIDALINAGLLANRTVGEASTHRITVVELTGRGREVMTGKSSVSLALPAEALPEGERAGKGRAGARSSRQGWAEGSLAGAFATAADDDDEDYSPRVYNAIVRWRSKRAKQAGVPPFMILSNRTARALSRACPRTIDALLEVKGMGPVKCSSFGDELIEIVERFNE